MSKPERSLADRRPCHPWSPPRSAILVLALVMVGSVSWSRGSDGTVLESRGGSERTEQTPTPVPIPLPEPGADAEPASGGAGWIAVAEGATVAEVERMLRAWAASVAPALSPYHERMPNGAHKLHHRGHFVTSLYATLDADGRLRYGHLDPLVAVETTPTPRPPGGEVSVDSAAPSVPMPADGGDIDSEGGAR